jgi:signal transduction histidine kinase
MSQAVDSLKKVLSKTQNDTAKIGLLTALTLSYNQTKPDSSFKYADNLREISRKLHYALDEAFAFGQISYALLELGKYPRSLQNVQEGIRLAEDPASEKNILPDRYGFSEDRQMRPFTPRLNRLNALGNVLQVAGILYSNMNNYRKELTLDSQILETIKETGNLYLKCRTQITIGIAYSNLASPDSALLFLDSAQELALSLKYKRFMSSILLNKGRIYRTMHNNEKATTYFREAVKEGREEYPRGAVAASIDNGALFSLPENKDSALWYAYNSLELASGMEAPQLILRAYTLLGNIYRRTGKDDSAVKYLGLVIKMKDSQFNAKQAQQFENVDFAQQQKDQELLNAQKSYKNRLALYGVLTWACIFLVIASILWRNNRNKQKDYALLQSQKQETENQKNKAEATLKDLRTTQAQLIQSEKMASLGELTAGISHELQNPLNFVNNFSDLNGELVDELQTQLKMGNQEEALRISSDIKQNESKINHHGKRAESIVRSMLQHSRVNTGQIEPVEINALADEYFRIAYHGYRGKDHEFKVSMQTHFDHNIGKVNVNAQEIGRVLLNLFNNAFYSVSEKSKSANGNYEPSVTLETSRNDSKIEIKVKDNGPGIPDKVTEKIFQPFFTTKPTGQGTGLGLSLAYDIVKAHGGLIRVENKEGKGAEFIVELPYNQS